MSNVGDVVYGDLPVYSNMPHAFLYWIYCLRIARHLPQKVIISTANQRHSLTKVADMQLGTGATADSPSADEQLQRQHNSSSGATTWNGQALPMGRSFQHSEQELT
ncbi:hypothetical protein F2P81_021999 [Scophthalmus maximus]|uniref:Uncharacterized protein n=1 Tax=Scophthalmus maximus TaxID=52904 RepID=A0A6A4RYX9_SCOMX|nr:hypothetical protein F2P81_021999 [Scophthalmus maximus]